MLVLGFPPPTHRPSLGWDSAKRPGGAKRTGSKGQVWVDAGEAVGCEGGARVGSPSPELVRVAIATGIAHRPERQECTSQLRPSTWSGVA